LTLVQDLDVICVKWPRKPVSRAIQRYKPSLERQFWNEKAFWSDGYFVCSVGNTSAKTIRKYIREQG